MKKVALVVSALFVGGAVADSTPTSVGYVDSQIGALQNKISAIDTNTVLTTTNTAGEIGQKSIYDTTGNYVEQQNALVTAEVANAAVQNAIDGEFVCTEWLDGAEHTNENCLIYEIRAAKLALMPTGYTQLEYIESTGTQYINTGVIPTNTTGVKIKFNRYTTSDQVVLGVLEDNSANFYINPAGAILLPFAEHWTDARFGAIDNHFDYEILVNYMNDRKRYINNTEVTSITKTLGQSYEMYLFAGNYASKSTASWFFNGRVYYLTMTEDSEIIRNLIPARRDSDGEIGMYDLVSNTFFTNAGTGEFIAGPELNVYLPNGNSN